MDMRGIVPFDALNLLLFAVEALVVSADCSILNSWQYRAILSYGVFCISTPFRPRHSLSQKSESENICLRCASVSRLGRSEEIHPQASKSRNNLQAG